MVIYSFKDCSHCDDLKKELNDLGIKYEEKDLDITNNRDEVIKISKEHLNGETELPIVEKDGKFYSRPTIEELNK